ncbi:hypothetical protein C0993_007709 [Termitomyces sp. T159_Od127]|nr:hypothetical protein C0993_007709 [Termitomyces sp. T159_Od127]
MAPTLQNGVGQATTLKDAKQPTPSAGSFQKAYKLHRQRSTLKPWRRQNQAESAPWSDVDTMETSGAYTPTTPLHAKIIPHNDTMTSQSHTSRFGHLSIIELILISLVALLIVVVGVTALVMRSIIIKKVRRLLCCGGQRQVRKSKTGADDKGALVMGDELDDPAWGTPTRLVYVEGPDERFEERCSTPPDGLPSSLPPVISLAASTPTSPRLSTAYEDVSFKNRFEYEEHDITLALTRALRDATDVPDFQVIPVPYPIGFADKDLAAIKYCENPSILDAPSVDNVAKSIRISSNRPRQCSDASASSQATTAANSDCTNIFSVLTPDSSISSSESSNSDLGEGPEMEEMVYEVKRAHAQSLELKKGILVTCRRTSSTSDVANPGMLPTFVISEAPPNLMPLDDLNFAPLFSLSDSKASLSRCTTTPSWSSLVRENSRGTMASFSSSSTTAMDGWNRDDEMHLHPPVPFLMLTRPSDSSIYTATSSTSSVSIDLCDFPSPPIPETSYYSKLADQVQRAPKRLWDNHSAESSMAQKRSTVERFIKMYSIPEEK